MKYIYLINELKQGLKHPYKIYRDDEEIQEDIHTYIVKDELIDFNKYKISYETLELTPYTNYELYQENRFHLAEGEYFDDEHKIRKEPQPNRFAKWNRDTKSWEINLEEYKLYMEEKLKKERCAKIESDILYKDNWYQVRSGDLENFNDAERAIQRGTVTLDDFIIWRMSDNTEHRVTYGDLRTVMDMRAYRKKEIYAEFIGLIHKVYSATTIEELENIKWIGDE